jgi:small subunit ribosomal protein S6
MVRYEILMLVRSESTAEERAFLEKSISGLVAQHNGVVSSFDQWGKLRLAYPVQKENYGLYILVRFELPNDAVVKFTKDLNMFFRIKTGEFVLRHTVVRVPAGAPATYAHPEPVDSSKALAEAGSFVRGEGRGDRGDRADRGGNFREGRSERTGSGYRGDRSDRTERSERPFQVIGGSGKRFSHDHSSDDVMSSITDEMDS